MKTSRPRFLRQGSYKRDRNEGVESSRGRRSLGVRFLDFNPRREGLFCPHLASIRSVTTSVPDGAFHLSG